MKREVQSQSEGVLKNRNTRKFILVSMITLSFLSFGVFLLETEWIGFGISLFVFLPFILGYVLGSNIIKKWSLFGFLFTFLIFLILLLIGQIEGMICVLMALPIILGFVALGALIRFLKNRYIDQRDEDILDRPNSLKVIVFPLLIFAAIGISENKILDTHPEVLSESTSLLLPYTNTQVYNAIKHVDTLDVEPTFLMKLDLPIPLKCVLENEEVGALRTCYFEEGKIVERITQLEPGKELRMDVIKYELTGRSWLNFKEAIYYFEEVGLDSCKITRVTTFTTELKPRWYWEKLERIGIQQEHDYVLRNLSKDLALAHSTD